MKRLEFSQLMRRGRLSLFVGSVFLASMPPPWSCRGEGACRHRLRHHPKEGLTIAGWVAMWRPLEIYLYDWWPLFEERRRLERLARMQVRIEMPGPQTPEGVGRSNSNPKNPIR
jgi:hypothetical protein